MDGTRAGGTTLEDREDALARRFADGDTEALAELVDLFGPFVGYELRWYRRSEVIASGLLERSDLLQQCALILGELARSWRGRRAGSTCTCGATCRCGCGGTCSGSRPGGTRGGWRW